MNDTAKNPFGDLRNFVGKTEKFCIFCGQKPDAKSMEHVIPKWLIQMTGDPKRPANLGVDVLQMASRTYALDQFVFPACTACNGRFSELENRAKRVVETMLDNGPLGAWDLDLFLDWLDKVRVGLWLGFQYLDKNLWGITPHFQIETRIGAHDRLLVISRTDYPKKHVTWIGANVPAFQFLPSCFALWVNDLVFFNASRDFLLAKRLGFPFPKTRAFRQEDESLVIGLREGYARIRNPVLRKPLKIQGAEFYQCLFQFALQDETLAPLYDSEYVRENTLDAGMGKSRVFIPRNTTLVPYSEIPSRDWLPRTVEDYEECKRKTALQVFDLQNRLLEDSPSMELMTPENREIAQINFRNSIRFNKQLANRIRKEWRIG
jgi:hypothetical protein